jgi:hypothetical protein
LAGRGCAKPGRRKALLAWAGDLILGLPPADASPVFASTLRRHRATLACASASAPATACIHPNQSADAGTTGRPVTAGLDLRRPSHGHAWANLSLGAVCDEPACFDRTTSREVWSPSAHTGRDALSGVGIVIPGRPPDDPASAFWIPVGPRHVRWTSSTDPSPLRFFAIGGAKRRRSIWRTFRTGSRSSYSLHRCDHAVVIASLHRRHEPLQIQSSFDHSCGCFRGNQNRTLTRIRPSERNRFNPPSESGHAPSRSFGAVFRYPHGSFASFLAPLEPFASEAHSSLARTFAAWPNDWSFPHRSAALMGF